MSISARNARLIRMGIMLGRSVYAKYTEAGWDAFSRGMQYYAMRPKRKLAVTAYRRTWHRLEGF